MHQRNTRWTVLVWLAGCVLFGGLTTAAPVALKVGDAVPLVSGKNQDGQEWSLSNYVGKKILLVYFYPKDDTPGCTAEACGLRERMVELNKDQVEVFGVSFDNAESHRNFREKHHLNFDLIVDIDGKIADAFGARRSAAATMDRRVSFLIGLDGKIAHITDNPSASVHLEEMKTAIAKLTAGTAH